MTEVENKEPESWLYGDESNTNLPIVINESSPIDAPEAANPDVNEDSQDVVVVTESGNEENKEPEEEDLAEEDIDKSLTESNGANADEEGLADEEDEDDINVIIKPLPKTGSGTTSTSIYKSGAAYQTKPVVQAPKQGIDLDDPGNVNGMPTLDFNLTTLQEEEKAWKRPGADITDYFNYGFQEDTWMQYCEKQRLLRQQYVGTALKPVIVGNSALKMRTIPASLSRPFQSMNRPSHVQSVGTINVIGSTTTEVRRPPVVEVDTPSVSGQETPSAISVTGFQAAPVVGLDPFSQPPPGFNPSAGSFTMPPPGYAPFPTALAAVPPPMAMASLYPNTALPPPGLGLGAASFPTGIPGVWPPGMTVPGAIPERENSPDSMKSNEDYGMMGRDRDEARSHRPERDHGARDRDMERDTRSPAGSSYSHRRERGSPVERDRRVDKERERFDRERPRHRNRSRSREKKYSTSRHRRRFEEDVATPRERERTREHRPDSSRRTHKRRRHSRSPAYVGKTSPQTTPRQDLTQGSPQDRGSTPTSQ